MGSQYEKIENKKVNKWIQKIAFSLCTLRTVLPFLRLLWAGSAELTLRNNQKQTSQSI